MKSMPWLGLYLLVAHAFPDPQDLASKAKPPTAVERWMAQARKQTQLARGLQGVDRALALEQAAETWLRAVGPIFQPDPLAAEAAFRAGEIWRSLGKVGLARSAFQMAFDCGRGIAFAPRALLELAHLRRRDREMGAALAGYARVLKLPETLLRQENDAHEWLGRCRLLLDQPILAEARFAIWQANAEGPMEEVRAATARADAFLKSGHTAAAQSLLLALRHRLRPFAELPIPEAPPLARALHRLSAHSAFLDPALR